MSYQRWSQGRKARGQGHKKSEAKDSTYEERPSRGQGQECSRPRQARRQDGVTVGAEINFRGAREVDLCEIERGTGAREIYSSVDQTNKVKTKK